MVQILKDSQRALILETSKQLFVLQGIEKTSMRAIANNANMTVGNIYRYFENKEELVATIINPCIEKLSNTMMQATQGKVELFKQREGILLTDNYLMELLHKISNSLVEIRTLYKDELYIITNDSLINDKFHSWFYNLIKQILVESKNDIIQSNEQLELLTTIISKSIFVGISEAIKYSYSSSISNDELNTVLTFYLTNSFQILKT